MPIKHHCGSSPSGKPKELEGCNASLQRPRDELKFLYDFAFQLVEEQVERMFDYGEEKSRC